MALIAKVGLTVSTQASVTAGNEIGAVAVCFSFVKIKHSLILWDHHTATLICPR